MVVGFIGAVGPQLALLRAIRFGGSNAADEENSSLRYHLASRKQIRWEDWEWKTGFSAVVVFLGVVLATTELSYSSSWVVIVALLSTFTWMSVVGVILDRGKMKSMISHRNTAE